MLEQTLIQRLSPDDIIGRISAAYLTIENSATLLGALLASLLEHALGLTMTLNLAIAVITAGGALAILTPMAGTAGKHASARAETGAPRVHSSIIGSTSAGAASR
jgi:hypothetical protein